MRLGLVLEDSDAGALFDNEGSDWDGEPDDPGCDTQSSDNECSQAGSIVIFDTN